MDLKAIANGVGSVASAFGPIASGIGAIGSLFGNIFDRNSQEKENEKNRQFAADQAQLSRDYNTEMWNRTNEYNSPKAQMERLMSAGLNPMLAYGSLGGSSASMQSSSPASASTMPSGPNLADGFANFGQQSMQTAQTALLNAQARKTDAEAEQQEIDNKYEDLLKTQEFRAGNVRIKMEENLATKYEAEAKTAIKDLNNYDLKLDDLRSQIAERLANTNSIEQKVIFQKLQNYIKGKTKESEIERIMSEAKYTRTQADLAYRLISSSILLNLMSAENQNAQKNVAWVTEGNLYAQRDVLEQEVKNMVIEANNMNLFGAHLQLENNMLQFDFDQKVYWDDIERGVGIFNSVASSLTSGFSSIGVGTAAFRGLRSSK